MTELTLLSLRVTLREQDRGRRCASYLLPMFAAACKSAYARAGDFGVVFHWLDRAPDDLYLKDGRATLTET